MSSPADLGAPAPIEDPDDVQPGDDRPVDGQLADGQLVDGQLVDGQPVDEAAPYPPVLAVIVTRNPGDWFDDALRSLAVQDYPALRVLVVDCGSDDDPTPRVAALLPDAAVRRRADAGFAVAANEALESVTSGGVAVAEDGAPSSPEEPVEDTPFLLLCHDDVVLDPVAVRVMVEEAYRSNAGVVGPKLVRADDPEVLLEVGRAIDRFGAPYTGIELGELDQEQHDGVRDVFYVTSATMLVRVDLFHELGGFDPATFPGSEDLDLCWRARLVGARVLVAPDARVAHREAADDRLRGDRPDEFALSRTRVRVLLTSYSLTTLLWLVPMGIVVGFVEAIGDLVTGRPRRARAAIGAWISNLLHFRRLRPSRRRAQALRHIHDRDLRELQVGSLTRLNAFVSHHMHGDDRIRSLSSRSRNAVDSVSDGMRTPASLAFFGFVLMVLLGSRDLITRGVPSIGTMVSWPGVGSLFDTFGSAWRYTGLGSASPQPAVQAVMGGIGTLLFGSVGLGRTLVVVVALPLGAFGASRLTRRVLGLRGPALAAGLVYGINPVARNAIAEGRLGALVLFALLPFLLSQIVAIVGLDAAHDDLSTDAGDDAAREVSTRPRGRLLRFALLLAFTTAWCPLAPAYVALAVLAMLVISPFVGRAASTLRAFGIVIAGTLGALVLLFPWPLAYVGALDDPASLGFAFRPTLSVSEVMRFDTGPVGAGWAMWGLVIAAAVPLFLAIGPRLAWTARGWSLALAGWAIVWLPAQFAPDVSVPAPEAGLVVAAVGLAIAVGVGVSVLVDGMHAFRFGWRQPAAILGGVALLLPFLAFTANVGSGRWDAPESDWSQTLAFTAAQTARGQFRMLWIGDPEVLPLDPVVLESGTAYTLTRNGPGDATELLRAPADDADQVIDDSIELTEEGLTNRLGRLLAPAGVRYLSVPSTQGNDGGARAAPSSALRAALDDQLDLARLRTDEGLVLYENLAWVPLQAVVTGAAAGDVPVGDVAPVASALRVDLAADAEPVDDSVAAKPGLVLWAEAYDSAWNAEANGKDLVHRRTFGWSNGFDLERRGRVSLAYGDQWQRWAMLAVALVIWLVAARWWWKTRFVRDGTVRSTRRERRERAARRDPLAEVLEEDTFWWERT
jgi:GT2 family glycosyltransferase